MYDAMTRYVERHLTVQAVAGNIAQAHLVGTLQRGFDHPHRCVDAVNAGLDPAHPCQCGHQANRAMAAHAEHAYVVKKNDACCAAWLARFAQQRAHHCVGPAWLIAQGAPDMIELLVEYLAPLCQRAAAEIRASLNNQPGWFPACMGVNDPHGGELAGTGGG